MPIRSLLSRRILVIACVQVLLSLAIAKWQLYPDVERLQVSLNASLANNIARSAHDAFNHPMLAVASGATVLDEATANKSAIEQSTITQLVNSQPAAESAYIIGPDGVVRTTAFSARYAGSRDSVNRKGLDMSRNALYLQRNRSKVAISALFISSVSEELQVAITAPLRSGALLVLELGLGGLAREVNGTVADSDMRVMIIDASGQLVVNPDATRSGENAMLPIDVIHALKGSGAATFYLNDRHWFATSATVGQLDWRVVVMRPADAVYAPINAIVGLLLVITILLLAFSYLALLFTIRRVQTATQALISDAHQLEHGTIPPEHRFGILELAQIDSSLRAMARGLLYREAQLKESNDVLEARVQDRTLHLEQANSELQSALVRLQSTQDELVQSGKMAALGAMVAGVAHELNTPIGNARLVATTLLDRAQALSDMLASGKVSRKEMDELARDFQNAGDIIDKSLSRASDLVRSFKQVAADQTSNQRRTFKLLDVVRENELLLSPRMKKAGIQLVVDMDAELAMDSYPGDIGQIITNLVENAMVHAYAGMDQGAIDISARLRDSDTVTLRVTDHGGGIDAANLGRIFDPFFTTRMGRGGTGLGLSIVYSIVAKSLGGKIHVESVVGQGTTFHVELARVAPQSAPVGHAV